MKEITCKDAIFAVALTGLSLLGAYYAYEATAVITSASVVPVISDSPEHRKYLPLATALLDEDSKKCADPNTELWARCLFSLRHSRAERLLVATDPQTLPDSTLLAQRMSWLSTNEKLIPVVHYADKSDNLQQKVRPNLHPWLSI